MTLKERFLNLFRSRKTKRSYFSGASQNRLLNNFVLSSKFADSEIRPSLRVLRNRARDLARNNAFARRYISVYVDNVVGAKGVHLQVRSRDPNGRLDSFANNLIERRWKEWGYNCTADGKLSWIDCQRLFAEYKKQITYFDFDRHIKNVWESSPYSRVNGWRDQHHKR